MEPTQKELARIELQNAANTGGIEPLLKLIEEKKYNYHYGKVSVRINTHIVSEVLGLPPKPVRTFDGYRLWIDGLGKMFVAAEPTKEGEWCQWDD